MFENPENDTSFMIHQRLSLLHQTHTYNRYNMTHTLQPLNMQGTDYH